jgi:hypothetical protein
VTFRYIHSEKSMITVDFKNIGLQLCTCTYIEIMTGLGISLYLLYMQNYSLAILSAIIFAPLILFHYVVSRLTSGRRESSCDTESCSSSSGRLRFTRLTS